MNATEAQKILDKYSYSPEHAKNSDCYGTFCTAWELLYPEEYWQVIDTPHGKRFNLVRLWDDSQWIDDGDRY